VEFFFLVEIEWKPSWVDFHNFYKWIGAVMDLEVWVVENCFQFCVCVCCFAHYLWKTTSTNFMNPNLFHLVAYNIHTMIDITNVSRINIFNSFIHNIDWQGIGALMPTSFGLYCYKHIPTWLEHPLVCRQVWSWTRLDASLFVCGHRGMLPSPSLY